MRACVCTRVCMCICVRVCVCNRYSLVGLHALILSVSQVRLTNILRDDQQQQQQQQ